MIKNNQEEELKKAFYSDGFQLGMQVAENNFSPAVMREAIQLMYKNMDGLIDSLQQIAQGGDHKVACKLGCEWCCHQPVFALDYEMDYLRWYLEEYFDEDTLKEINNRAKEKEKKLSALPEANLLNSKHPCPLLSDGACMAYEARPMACRIYLSSKLDSCIRFFEVPNDKKNFPALLQLPLQLGRMLNEGFKAALKMTGTPVKEFRIEEKLIK